MAHLATADALSVGSLVGLVRVIRPRPKLIVFSLMLVELAPRVILIGLSAAPPEGATPRTRVRTTRPVEILLLYVFLVALLADLGRLILIVLALLIFLVVNQHDRLQL